MKTHSHTVDEWQMLCRLRSAGCPIEFDGLPPAGPLRIQLLSNSFGTHLLPFGSQEQHTLVLLPLVLYASVSTAIWSFRAEPACFEFPTVSGVPRRSCELRVQIPRLGRICVECSLNVEQRYPMTIKRGTRVRGLLAGKVLKPRPADGDIDLTFWFEDDRGDQHPYPLRLQNRSVSAQEFEGSTIPSPV